MKRKKRKKLRNYPQSDAQSEYNYNSLGHTTTSGPRQHRGYNNPDGSPMMFDTGGEVEDNEIEMSLNDFVKEHTNLLSILKSGSKKDRLAEYKRQNKELKKYMGFGGVIPPEQQISIGQDSYRNMLMKRRGGRVQYALGGTTAEGSFGGKKTEQPVNYVNPDDAPTSMTNTGSSTNFGTYAGYAAAGLNAYNSYNQASKNPNLNQSQKTAAGVNAGVNSVLGAVFPYHQYAKMASDLGKSTLKTNEKGEYATGTDRQAASAMTAPHETAIDHAIGNNDWWAAGHTLLSGGVSDRVADSFNIDPNTLKRKTREYTGTFDPNFIQGTVDSQYNDTYLAGSRGIANNNTAMRGGRIRAQYANGGLIKRLPGGMMVNQGSGIQTAIGRTHESGGIGYNPQTEIETGEHVINNDYVLTNMPHSEPMMKTSIAKRFNKNLNAISDRNPSEVKALGTERLKNDAIIKNEEYLAGSRGIANSQMARRGGKVRKYYPGGPGADSTEYYTSGTQYPDFANRILMGTAYPGQQGTQGSITDGSVNRYWNSPMTRNQSQELQADDPNAKYLNADEVLAQGMTQDSRKFDYGKLPGYLQYAKPLADLYGALQKPARLKPHNYMIPGAKANLLTDDASLREINTGYHTGLYNLKNSGNYSRAAQVNLAGQRMKAAAASRERLANQNAGILNQNEALNREIDAKNMSTRLGIDHFNIGSKSKKNEYLSQLGIDLSNIGMMEDIRNKYPEYYRNTNKAKRGGRLNKMKNC